MPIYVTCMGDLFALSKAAYKRYLKEVSEKGSADVGNYGKNLGRVCSVTDINRSEAETILTGGYCSNLPRLS